MQVGWEYFLHSVSPHKIGDTLVGELEHEKHYHLVSRARSRLGGLQAERFVFDYRDPISGERMKYVYMMAVSTPVQDETGAPESCYTFGVSLTTPAAKYQEDKVEFERTIATWRADSSDGRCE